MNANQPQPFGKMDIINHLAGRYGYRRYLEIATGTTGGKYALIDRSRFADCRRLLYRCPPGFDDGLAIDYRCVYLDISPALAAIRAEGRRFDAILVDPFHTYAASLRDLEAAYDLLDAGGVLVVHDCLPPDEKLAAPDFIDGDWCGLTYKAYLDFVLSRRDLRYITVDTDYGCGVVRKLRPRPAARLGLASGPRRRLIREWQAVGGDDAAAWGLFTANQAALLRLTSVEGLLAGRHDLGRR